MDLSVEQGTNETGCKVHASAAYRWGEIAVMFTSSQDENYRFARDLVPLPSHSARKFLCRSDLNVSSCG